VAGGGELDDLTSLSGAGLDARLQALAIEIAVAESKIEPPAAGRKRTRKLVRGVALNVFGLVMSVPTGGISLIICAAGVKDMVDVVEEDATVMNMQIRLRQDLERFKRTYDAIAAEKARRAPRNRTP